MENPKSCRFFTSQFQVKKFLLEFEEPPLLGTAQCGRLQPLYIIYRSLWAVWWVGLIIYDIYTDIQSKTPWYSFTTNWGLTLLTISSVLQLITSIYHVLARPDRKDLQKMPILYKIDWVFYELSSVAAAGVSVLFWTLLFDGTIGFTGFASHGINIIYVLIDIFITGAPFRILHFFYSTIFVIIYSIFYVIYQLGFNQGPVYDIFDWKKSPGQAVGVVVSLIVVSFVFQILLFFLYWVKVLLCCSCKKANQGSRVDVEIPDKY